MKSPLLVLGPVAAAIALLSACGSGSSSTPSPAAESPAVEQPAAATLASAMSRVELTAEGADTVALPITNQSPTITVRSVAARLPSEWTDVKQDASDCVTLAPLATCSLVFTPGVTTRAATDVRIEGENLTPMTLSFSIAAPTTAPLTVDHSPLSMMMGMGGGQLRVTNQSRTLTATDITADFTGTPLAHAVKQDASDCASVAPGDSCSLRFYVGSTAVAPTSFPIKGRNTNPVGATIEITAPLKATLGIAGSPLVLQADPGAPVAGHLTITNTSSVVATGITATLAGTALDGFVTQDASACATLAPATSCQLAFTPGTAAVPATPIEIQGSNTSRLGASIAVNAIRPSLSVSGSPMTLLKSGAARAMTITNTSAIESAQQIEATLAGTALSGHVTVSGSTCGATLAPGASCTLTFLPGPTPVPATAFTIAGLNTPTVSASLAVRDLAIGDDYAGGTVIQLPSGSLPGLAITKNSVLGQAWAPDATLTPAAQDMNDGAANTAGLVAKYGASNTYAAGYCSGLVTTDGSTSYADWYLPAANEAMAFGVVYTADPSRFPGMTAMFILTSTEHSAGSVKVSESAYSGDLGWDGKNNMRPYAGTHCLLAF